mgnify:CR=1 FL=1
MHAVFNLALPLFALIFTGYGAGRWGRLGATAIGGLTHFVFYFALPALLITKISEAPLQALFDPRLLLSYYGAGLTLYAITYGLGRLLFPARPAIYALRSLAVTFSNVGFVGLPLVILAFGEAATPPAVMVLVLDGAIMIGLTVAIIEGDLGDNSSRRAALVAAVGGMFRNPLIVASLIGIAMALLGIKLPAPLATYGNVLGAAAAPCALFALGATLVRRPPAAELRHGRADTALICLLKLVVHPALVWLLASQLFALPPLWTAVLVVEAALPVAANVYLLSERYRLYTAEASTAVLASTVLALFTVSVVLSHYYPG